MARNKETILITDDDPGNLRVLTRALEPEGYEIRVATTGEQALESVRAAPPDLILLDIQLPKMDGYEVCKELKNCEDLSPIPVVFISGMTEPYNKVLAFEVGGDDFILKPFQTEEVVARVGTHLELSQMRRDLEERVEERTAQLKTAVEDLQREVAARTRLTTILEATSDLVLMSLPDDSVAYINRAGRKLVGWGADEDVNERQTRTIFPKPTRRLIRTEIVPTAERDGLWEGEATVFGPDQSEIPVSMVVMTHRSPDGEIERYSAIIRDISERRKARQALLESREQLRALAAELAAAEDRERRRIATYLHDQIGQALAVLRIRFGALKVTADPADAEKLVTEISDLLEWAIEETNTLTFDLSPPILYELGLEAALEWVGETVCEKHDVAFSFVGAEQKISLTEEMASLLFRCARELVMNVVKHSKAQHVVIGVTTQANSISITVEDDGAGFDTSVLAEDRRMDRFGLYSIRERMAFIGGEFTIDSDLGQGTRATITTGVAGGASRNEQE